MRKRGAGNFTGSLILVLEKGLIRINSEDTKQLERWRGHGGR